MSGTRDLGGREYDHANGEHFQLENQDIDTGPNVGQDKHIRKCRIFGTIGVYTMYFAMVSK